MNLPKSGFRDLLVTSNFPHQSGDSDLKHTSQGILSLFLLLTGVQFTFLWPSLGSHKCFFYCKKNRKKLAGIFKMVEVVIPDTLGFVVHDHQTHARATWNGADVPLYGTHFIGEGGYLKNAVAFALGPWLACNRELHQTDEGKTSCYVSVASEQDGCTSSS